jgi:hypothetical protein
MMAAIVGERFAEMIRRSYQTKAFHVLRIWNAMIVVGPAWSPKMTAGRGVRAGEVAKKMRKNALASETRWRPDSVSQLLLLVWHHLRKTKMIRTRKIHRDAVEAQRKTATAAEMWRKLNDPRSLSEKRTDPALGKTRIFVSDTGGIPRPGSRVKL